MPFARQEAKIWHTQVPGARWFKADLHTHTLDDFPGGNVQVPDRIDGPIDADSTISTYARTFLQSAAERAVQVLGLTPHSTRVGSGEQTSVVWRIVEEWQRGCDDDGVPFRNRIYAVFPGFEPSLNHGKSGLHLLFLFDPEIGRENYHKAFNLVMGGVSPWRAGDDSSLQMSDSNPEKAFRDLRRFHVRERGSGPGGGDDWRYIVLAPHIDAGKGLLGAQKAQVLRFFQHDEIAGLELGDQKLPKDYADQRPWLLEAMRKHRQSFFHSSDAYSVSNIGARHTWIKMARPRIEALRQAFIAGDSRLRIGFERLDSNGLSEIEEPPDVTARQRPWLKCVEVSGRASFFGEDGSKGSGARFLLSPDLTCIIGGSMTGKSTFLDGLRVYVDAILPDDERVREQIEARGRDRFLGGSATVVLDCPGRDSTAAPHEQWPAVFYTQSELQQLAQSPDAVEEILSRLVVSEAKNIRLREERLAQLDEDLVGLSKRINQLASSFGEAEQALARSQKAADELAAFADAGVGELNQASSDLHMWENFQTLASDVDSRIQAVTRSVLAADLPESTCSPLPNQGSSSLSDIERSLRSTWNRIHSLLQEARSELVKAIDVAKTGTNALDYHERLVRAQVDRRLAERGFDGARISELQALNVQAALVESYEANLVQRQAELDGSLETFGALRRDRQCLIEHQRASFNVVMESVQAQFGGRIRARRIDSDRKERLESFVRGLGQRGITRWWNDLRDEQQPNSEELLLNLELNLLDLVGMSNAVQDTFREQLTPANRRELAALRCRDRYLLELKVSRDKYRELMALSGGQRVSLLLSLLLETNDERPLVIDQPEDELDNRSLFETLLPALKRLKGRRQIIIATHNANIVVNGDADQVLHLEATADRGRVTCMGAIEQPVVRDAIVRTVDGGAEAFELRRLKYGY